MTIDGDYTLTIDTPMGQQKGTMTIRSNGGKVSGTLSNGIGETDFSDGALDGDAVRFDVRIPTPIGRLRAHVAGRFEGDHFTADAKLPLGHAKIAGDRTH